MTNEEFRDMITLEAVEIVAAQVPKGQRYDDLREAQIDLHMLAQGLRAKTSVESSLRWVVVRMAETRSWMKCEPDEGRWPDGFISHTQFIQEAIVLAGWDNDQRAKNVRSRLNKVANLAFYAKLHGISIDAAMNLSWSQLRDGLPAIGRALEANDGKGDPEMLEVILDDVQDLSPKDFKEKYVTPRHKKAGFAAFKTTPHGVTVLAAVLNSREDMKRVSDVLQGLFKWELDLRVVDTTSGATVIIERAQQLREPWVEPAAVEA